MKLLFFCPIWGSTHLPFEEFLQKVIEDGYDGVECTLPNDNPVKQNSMVNSLKNSGLKFIGQHWETVSANFQQHKSEYIKRLHNLALGNPIMINSQTGRDFFSFNQNMELIEAAEKFSLETGIKVVHETHRGKFSFAAHITREFLIANPNIRIVADFSHWCNVAETMLADQPEAMALAISRADHIHARVGFAEGPQITDPRATEWKEILDIHIEWWEAIISRAKKENRDYFPITPEFGPAPYMALLPYSNIPVASQWDLNLFMKDLLGKKFLC